MILKSIYFSVLIASFSFALNSCGGSASGDGGKKTACDCLKEGKELAAEAKNAMGDEGKMKDLEAKGKDLEEACKDVKKEDAKDCK